MKRFLGCVLPVLWTLGLPQLAPPTRAWAQSGLELAEQAEQGEARGDHALAAELFLEAHARMRTEPGLVYLAARNLARTGESERAVELLTRVLEEGVLLAGPLSRDSAFRRLEGDAAFERLLDRAKEREKEIDRHLREELLELAAADDTLTKELEHLLRESKWGSAPVDSVAVAALREEAVPVRARFREIVEEHGWPGWSLVGREGSVAAWQIAQHADTALQRELLPLLEQAADRGDASKSNWAYLLDRVRIRRGEKQRYGTQFRWSVGEGRWVLHPVEDPESLEARRAEIGLEPIEDYLTTMKDLYGEGPPR